MSHPAKHHDDDLLLFPEAANAAHHDEGRLAIDVSETASELVIVSPIAGVKPEDLEVFMHNDMLTIRGKRHADLGHVQGGKHVIRECHWGSFSRSVILPIEIDANAINATIKDGVLTVRLPQREEARASASSRTSAIVTSNARSRARSAAITDPTIPAPSTMAVVMAGA